MLKGVLQAGSLCELVVQAGDPLRTPRGAGRPEAIACCGSTSTHSALWHLLGWPMAHVGVLPASKGITACF